MKPSKFSPALFKASLIVFLALWLTYDIYAQNLKLKTELQSSFIDITGLFGVDDPASITQLTYSNKGFGLDLYHSFSLKELGKSIQGIITPSYVVKIDKSGKFSLKPKVEIAHLEQAGGGFVRPGIHFLYKPNGNNLLNLGFWHFADFRNNIEFPKRLNGNTLFFSYRHTHHFKRWELSEEGRTLYVNINDGLKIAGVFANVQLKYKPWNIYVETNNVYTFYRSDNKNEFFWNLTLGIQIK
jgi:hypothetical protein